MLTTVIYGGNQMSPTGPMLPTGYKNGTYPRP